MALALAVAALAVALGALLALVPTTSARLIGPIKSFALTASFAVVLTHLVPEGFAGIGSLALLVFVLGALLPIALESAVGALWRRRAPGHSSLALEAGYAGLLVHKIGDGIGLSAYAGPVAGGPAQLDVMIALAAHTVPVVAVVQLAFEAQRGRSAGLVRSLGIGAAIALGVVCAGFVPAELVGRASPWVAALVSGLLLHVVMHDLAANPPVGTFDRSLDFAGALLGAAVPALGELGSVHGGDAERIARALGRSFVELSLLAAPLLLIGMLAASVVHRAGAGAPLRFARSSWALADALRGALAGGAQPLVAFRPRLARASSSTAIAALLLSAPALGIESVTLGVGLLGWKFTLQRLAGALAVAVAGALVLERLARSRTAPLEPKSEPSVPGPRSLLKAFDELFARLGPWMAAGIAAAAIVDVLVPAASLRLLDGQLIEMAFVALIALPSWLCAPAVTPIAAVLMQKGVSPAALLVGMLLGPTLSITTLRLLGRAHGARATALASVAIVACVWLFAGATSWLAPELTLPATTHPLPRWIAIGAAVALAIVLLRSIWLSGVRAWLATLAEHAQSSSRLPSC